MSDPKPTGFYRRFAVAALVVLAFTGFLGMIVSLLRDRQHGLSITASLANVPYSPNLQGNLIAGVILVAILWFRVVRRPSGPGWPRVRLRGTVWGGLWILTALAFLLLPRLGGRAVPWAWHDWAFVAVALVGLGRIIYFWGRVPPGR
jgi:ABC-type multidrug transport system permease subunit